MELNKKLERELEYTKLQEELNKWREYHELYCLKTFAIGLSIGMTSLIAQLALLAFGFQPIPINVISSLIGGSAIFGLAYGIGKSIQADVKKGMIEEKMQQLKEEDQLENFVKNGILQKHKNQENKIYYTFANQTLTQEELNAQTNSIDNIVIESSNNLDEEQISYKKQI